MTLSLDMTECRDATEEIRMLLTEGGHPELAEAIRKAMVGPTAMMLFWTHGCELWAREIPDPVGKAVALYRTKVW